MTTLKSIFKQGLLIAGLTMMVIGIGWSIYLEILRWDVPMTRLGHMVYMWKPTLFVITGAILAKFNI